MANYDIDRELLNASADGDDTRVRELLTEGAEPDKYKHSTGTTALHWASLRGRGTTVSILIQVGADLNIQDNDGWTALYWAAGNGYNEVAKILINAGADLNVKNNTGSTALHCAAVNGHYDVMITLIQAGAELNIQYRFSSELATLISSGAGPYLPNRETGKTLIQLAKHETIARLE